MGIKSTRKVTRETAIDLYADLKAKLKRRKWLGQATAMTDESLGDELDRLAEASADAEGTVCFTNYVVSYWGDEDLW